ncbi:MBL fold metallo-hydrolase [Actinophytocola gossypii]|uniref:MBL fold metallo-hydrolase n=1 Tax=Actinophytocola gossypii TaxID=2812003 RepID=A0ABT2J6H6_9PSEU|nr:MBL fold metallo-hydrolase [Actinophytocola gossypii]MCT2583472.1 MBL fold metallo-hydrolase [Actinophytocola gossypii]
MATEDVPGSSLTFVGTATTLLRLGGFTVLTDPNFLHNGQWTYIGQGLVSRRRTEPALQPADLPPLTAVVLSHLHGDHFDRIARRELDRDVPLVTTKQAAGKLSKSGFRATVPLATWDTQTFVDGDATLRVTAVPARHAAGPLGLLLPRVMGTVLEYRPNTAADPLRVYLSGDTVMHEDLSLVRERFPRLDHAVVHLGGTRVLGVLLTMDHRQGVDLIELLGPATAIAVHYDDYGVFHSPLSNFLVEVEKRRPAARVRVPLRGETIPLTHE